MMQHSFYKIPQLGQQCAVRPRLRQVLSSSKRSRRLPLSSSAAVRSLSTTTSEGHSTIQAFDRTLKRKQRNNAATAALKYTNDKATTATTTTTTAYDYLRNELATRLVDRLDDIRASDEGFPLALDIGAGAGHVYKAICAQEAIVGQGGMGGVRKLVQLDSAERMLHRDADTAVIKGAERCDTYRLAVANEEDKLPFPDGTFDLVISCAALHWVNDLPAFLSEIHRVLRPDGCFLLAMIGGTTLPELRVALVLAEQEREGGVSPHVGPFIELSDLGSLLQRAGFALPTLDTDTIRLSFPNAAVLMEHLQRMGESNASLNRRPAVGRDTFIAATCLYQYLFPESSNLTATAAGGDDDDDDAIEATVQVIYAIGWTPHASQQKPLERGTATHRMTEVAQHTKN